MKKSETVDSFKFVEQLHENHSEKNIAAIK